VAGEYVSEPHLASYFRMIFGVNTEIHTDE
jgi:hypothetical protein